MTIYFRVLGAVEALALDAKPSSVVKYIMQSQVSYAEGQISPSAVPIVAGQSLLLIAPDTETLLAFESGNSSLMRHVYGKRFEHYKSLHTNQSLDLRNRLGQIGMLTYGGALAGAKNVIRNGWNAPSVPVPSLKDRWAFNQRDAEYYRPLREKCSFMLIRFSTWTRTTTNEGPLGHHRRGVSLGMSGHRAGIAK